MHSCHVGKEKQFLKSSCLEDLIITYLPAQTVSSGLDIGTLDGEINSNPFSSLLIWWKWTTNLFWRVMPTMGGICNEEKRTKSLPLSTIAGRLWSTKTGGAAPRATEVCVYGVWHLPLASDWHVAFHLQREGQGATLTVIYHQSWQNRSWNIPILLSMLTLLSHLFISVIVRRWGEYLPPDIMSVHQLLVII